MPIEHLYVCYVLMLTCLASLVSLKRPIPTREDVRAIERVRNKIAEDDRYFKALLSFGNPFKVGLISDAECKIREAEAEKGKSKYCLSTLNSFTISFRSC